MNKLLNIIFILILPFIALASKERRNPFPPNFELSNEEVSEKLNGFMNLKKIDHNVCWKVSSLLRVIQTKKMIALTASLIKYKDQLKNEWKPQPPKAMGWRGINSDYNVRLRSRLDYAIYWLNAFEKSDKNVDAMTYVINDSIKILEKGELHEMGNIRSGMIIWLLSNDNETLRPLFKHLKHPNPKVRYIITRGIGTSEIKPNKDFEDHILGLDKLYKQKQQRGLRGLYLFAIGSIGQEKSLVYLKTQLGKVPDPDPTYPSTQKAIDRIKKRMAKINEQK